MRVLPYQIGAYLESRDARRVDKLVSYFIDEKNMLTARIMLDVTEEDNEYIKMHADDLKYFYYEYKGNVPSLKKEVYLDSERYVKKMVLRK